MDDLWRDDARIVTSLSGPDVMRHDNTDRDTQVRPDRPDNYWPQASNNTEVTAQPAC